MGAGDWIMATGQVKEIYAKKRIPVLVIGPDQKPKWSDIFENNPKILKAPPRGSAYHRLVNGGGARPYIVYKNNTRWIWREGTQRIGELFFTDEEKGWARQYAGAVMIEPNVKAIGHTNKAWPFERWQQVVDRRGLDFVQCVQPGGGNRELRGVRIVETPSFRHAAAVLSVSRTFLGAEGGLMHAAAAVDKPSVILWSEFIEPSVTGYPMHRNIRHAGKACGLRIHCAMCAASMLAISVDEVLDNLRGVLSEET